MTQTEIEAYDAMMADRDSWKERFLRLAKEKALCPSVPCSALEFLAQELDMPAEHICEAARAMREKKITEAAKDLHAAFFVMRCDWKDGDFDLPPLARSHMQMMEDKAVELGKLLFRRQNAKSEAQSPEKRS